MSQFASDCTESGASSGPVAQWLEQGTHNPPTPLPKVPVTKALRTNDQAEVPTVVPDISPSVSGAEIPSGTAAFLAAWQRLSESEKTRILAQIQAAKSASE